MKSAFLLLKTRNKLKKTEKKLLFENCPAFRTGIDWTGCFLYQIFNYVLYNSNAYFYHEIFCLAASIVILCAKYLIRKCGMKQFYEFRFVKPSKHDTINNVPATILLHWTQKILFRREENFEIIFLLHLHIRINLDFHRLFIKRNCIKSYRKLENTRKSFSHY